MSLEVDEGLSVRNIIPSMANRGLRVASCASGALIPSAMGSTAFLAAKGGMMFFQPWSPVGQRRLKQWFMTLRAPLGHIA